MGLLEFTKNSRFIVLYTLCLAYNWKTFYSELIARTLYIAEVTVQC